MPEQVSYEQRLLVQCFAIVKRICKTFFGGNKQSFDMQASVACTLDNLRYENEKRAQLNLRKMRDLQKVVLGKLPVVKNEENDPNLGLKGL